MINIRTRGCPRWCLLRSTISTFANLVPAFAGIGMTSQNETSTALIADSFVRSSVTAPANDLRSSQMASDRDVCSLESSRSAVLWSRADGPGRVVGGTRHDEEAGTHAAAQRATTRKR